MANGAINIDRLDSDVHVTRPDSWDAKISFLPDPSGGARDLVAELMIMTNEIVGVTGELLISESE